MKARQIIEDETVPPAPGDEEASTRGFFKTMGTIDRNFNFVSPQTDPRLAMRVAAKLEPQGDMLRFRMWVWYNPRGDGSFAQVSPYQQFLRTDAYLAAKEELNNIFSRDIPAIDAAPTTFGEPAPASNKAVDVLRLVARKVARFKSPKAKKTRRPPAEL